MVVFVQSGFNRANMAVLGQKLLFSRKWLYSGKVVVFGLKRL